MIVELLVTLKVRENGENKLLSPGRYNSESPNFPEALRNESRFGVVNIIEGGFPPSLTKEAELVDEEDEEEEIVETEEEEDELPKKKKDKKRGR